MAFHPAEIDHSFADNSGPTLAGSHLANSSLSDFNKARTAMESPVIPAAFGGVAIDFGSDQARSEVKMAADQVPPPSPIVSGPGCKFTAFEDDEGVGVEVIPPKGGGDCVVEYPPDDQPAPKSKKK